MRSLSLIWMPNLMGKANKLSKRNLQVKPESQMKGELRNEAFYLELLEPDCSLPGVLSVGRAVECGYTLGYSPIVGSLLSCWVAG